MDARTRNEDHSERKRWRPGVVAVVMAQIGGLLVAYISGWVAFFALPPTVFGGRNGATTRAVGVAAAFVGAFALPGGCWVAWRRTRNPIAGGLALLVTVSALVVAAAWAFQLG